MRYLVNILQAVDVRAAVEVAMLLVPSTVLCLLIWHKSPWVKSFGRMLATVGLLTLFGWAGVAVGALTGPMPDNGFAIVCALLFGWAYVWILGLPILLVAFVLRIVSNFGWMVRQRWFGCEAVRGKPICSVVILLVVAFVLCPIGMSVRTAEMWKDWGVRQYRTKCVDGIVHVQIRENGQVVDVKSNASAYHRFGVESLSTDELLLKSSDVGSRVIRRVGDKWDFQADR